MSFHKLVAKLKQCTATRASSQSQSTANAVINTMHFVGELIQSYTLFSLVQMLAG